MSGGKSVVVGVVWILVGLSTALGILGGCGRGPKRESAGAESTAPVPAGAVHMTLTIQGLDSREGERVVEGALEGLDGVYRARASQDDHVIDVWYDPGRVDATVMCAAIGAEGYSPTE